MRRCYRMGAIALILLLLASCAGTSSPPAVPGTTCNNLANGGYVVEGDGWIFYSVPDSGIYRMQPDGSRVSLIYKEAGVSSLNYADDWLYYMRSPLDYSTDLNFYRIKPDGSGKEIIGTAECSRFCVFDDWIYYNFHYYFKTADSSGYYNKLYRMSIASGISECIIDDWIFQFFPTPEGLYFITFNDRDGLQLNHSALDGSHRELLPTNSLELNNSFGQYLVKRYNIQATTDLSFKATEFHFDIENNTLYLPIMVDSIGAALFASVNPQNFQATAQPVGFTPTFSFAITDGSLFYVDTSEDLLGIYRVSLDPELHIAERKAIESSPQFYQITDYGSQYVCSAGDWLFCYYSNVHNQHFRVRKDGTDFTWL